MSLILTGSISLDSTFNSFVLILNYKHVRPQGLECEWNKDLDTTDEVCDSVSGYFVCRYMLNHNGLLQFVTSYIIAYGTRSNFWLDYGEKRGQQGASPQRNEYLCPNKNIFTSYKEHSKGE